MESKEVEKATTRLYRPYTSSIELQKLYKKFNGDEYSIDEDVRFIDECFKKLEKENAELKSSNKYMRDNYILMKRIQEQDMCIKRLQGNKKNRESYIRNLKQQLQEKDKALDKACKELELSQCRILNFRGNDVETKEDWKEWAENETN